jgi:hypothetical protein
MIKITFWLKFFLLVLIVLITSTCMFWGMTDNMIISVIDLNESYDGRTKISISDNKLLVADEPVSIIDISNPVAPVIIGTYNTQTFQIAGSGQYIYTGSGQILDISDPSSPVEIANTNVTSSENTFVLDGNYIYCSSFSIVDVTNPLSPVEIYTIDMVSVDDIFVNGNFVYIVNDFGLTIMDVTDKSNPIIQGRMNDPRDSNYVNNYTRNIVVFGNTAYITNWNSKLLGIIDVTDKNNPIEKTNYKGIIENAIPTSMALEGDALYISYLTDPVGLFTSLAVFNIQEPAKPKLRIELNENTFRITDIEVNDNFLFLALDTGDVLIMKKP